MVVAAAVAVDGRRMTRSMVSGSGMSRNDVGMIDSIAQP